MKKYTAAYVDDDPNTIKMANLACQLYNKVHKDENFCLAGYSNIESFLEDYKARPDRFDSVMLDIQLNQEEDGWQVFERLLKEESKPTFIMCSNDIDTNDPLPSMMAKRFFSIENWIDRIEQLKPKWTNNIMQVFIRMADYKGTVHV